MLILGCATAECTLVGMALFCGSIGPAARSCVTALSARTRRRYAFWRHPEEQYICSSFGRPLRRKQLDRRTRTNCLWQIGQRFSLVIAAIAVMDLPPKIRARAAGQGTSCMVWLWVVTTAFVVVTFITVKLRGYKKMP